MIRKGKQALSAFARKMVVSHQKIAKIVPKTRLLGRALLHICHPFRITAEQNIDVPLCHTYHDNIQPESY